MHSIHLWTRAPQVL